MDSTADGERSDDPPAGRPVPVDTVPGWLRPPVIGSLRRNRRRWTIGWYSFAVALIVLLTAILVWPHRPSPAEQRVWDFLSAVRHGDVARAKGMTKVEFSRGVLGDSFLTADVLRQHWHVDTVRSVDTPDDYSDRATVDATISAPDGDTASYRFTVERADDDAAWKVADPYVYVTVTGFPLPYVSINGHRVALPHRHGEAVPGGSYTLFPGLYRFFDPAPDSVRHPTTAHLLMPGSYTVRQAGDTGYGAGSTITVPRMTLTGAAQRSAQRAVNAYLDRCAKAKTFLTVGCPFGTEYVPEPGHPDRVFLDDEATSVTWKMTRYPVVTVQPDGNEFLVVDRRPGTAKLTVTGTDRDTGFTATTSMTCDTNDNVLRADISSSGKFRVYPEGGRYGRAYVDHDPFTWESC